jgi:hypothetical protein
MALAAAKVDGRVTVLDFETWQRMRNVTGCWESGIRRP